MRKPLILMTSVLVAVAAPAAANGRYEERPPVVVSPDLSAPWVIQLGQTPGKVVRPRAEAPVKLRKPARATTAPDQVRTAAQRWLQEMDAAMARA